MATSGTAVWNPDVATLIEEASELAGYEAKSGFELRSAIRSINMIASEWANRGLNLWTIEMGSVVISAATSSAALPTDTVDVLDVVVRISSTDYTLKRIGVGSWSQISLKSQTSDRPNQFYVERTTTPIINVWPVPTVDVTLYYWRMRRIQDAGTVDNTLDVPHRFVPAFVWDLAVHLHAKRPDMKQDRLAFLESKRDQCFMDASDEDRGRESFWMAPG